MRKTLRIAVAFTAAILAIVLAGCGAPAQQGSPSSASVATASNGKYQVVCATFPAYDWAIQILGDRVNNYEVTYLTGGGVDLHSYQPSVEDMAKIANADLFVYVGGESDKWAEDAVNAANSEKLHTVNMLEAVGDIAVEEKVVEGMQEEEHAEGEEHEYDEHVWLSLRCAQVLVSAIAEELAAIDSAGAETYTANARAYNDQLKELDDKFTAEVSDVADKTVVFADRFPFRYLADDYGITYYAAFPGCSAETEASFETIVFLAKKLDDLHVKNVCVIEGSDKRIAETVIKSTKDANQNILVMDSLQSVTNEDIAGGKSYISAMKENLATLKNALG